MVSYVVLSSVASSGVFDRGQPKMAPPAGFAGDVRQPPALGVWRATGRTTSTAGYLEARDVGETIVRRWTTARRCADGRCTFVLTRELADGDRLTAALTSRADGWHATFNKPLPCEVVDGRALTWNQRSSFVLRFTHGGRRAEAHQVDVSRAPRCGYGTSRSDWTAALVGTAPATAALGTSGPAPRDRGHVNGISEATMAASVSGAVRAASASVGEQVSAAIGRPVGLEVLPPQTSCRSRQNTPTGTGAPFQCVVVAIDPDTGERLVLDVLVTAIEGQCWRGVNVAVKGNDGRWRDYDETTVARVLGRAPLRGCA